MAKKRKVLLIHPGTQYSYSVATQLFKRDYLLYFLTGVAIAGNGLWFKLLKFLPVEVRYKLKQRVVNRLTGNKLKLFPFVELVALKRVRKGDPNNEIFFDRNRKFQQKVPDKLIKEAELVICFDTSSWILARRCKEIGTPFMLDVSIAHSLSKQKVYHQLIERYPDWKFNIELKKQEFIDLEQLEYDESKAIIVASNFTKNTLLQNGVDPTKIVINPYGVDIDKFKVERKNHSGKIKFLFVGLVDARKGIPHLIDIWRLVSDENMELNIVGPITNEVENLIRNQRLNNINIVGKVPHAKLPEIFNENDIFIFPSFFEGFGLVILEAMASGLPVITSTATVGPDIIDNGKEGFVVEAGDDKGLINAITHFKRNPDMIFVMGDNARKKSEKYTWDTYGDRLTTIIDRVIDTK